MSDLYQYLKPALIEITSGQRVTLKQMLLFREGRESLVTYKTLQGLACKVTRAPERGWWTGRARLWETVGCRGMCCCWWWERWRRAAGPAPARGPRVQRSRAPRWEQRLSLMCVSGDGKSQEKAEKEHRGSGDLREDDCVCEESAGWGDLHWGAVTTSAGVGRSRVGRNR